MPISSPDDHLSSLKLTECLVERWKNEVLSLQIFFWFQPSFKLPVTSRQCICVQFADNEHVRTYNGAGRSNRSCQQGARATPSCLPSAAPAGGSLQAVQWRVPMVSLLAVGGMCGTASAHFVCGCPLPPSANPSSDCCILWQRLRQQQRQLVRVPQRLPLPHLPRPGGALSICLTSAVGHSARCLCFSAQRAAPPSALHRPACCTSSA